MNFVVKLNLIIVLVSSGVWGVTNSIAQPDINIESDLVLDIPVASSNYTYSTGSSREAGIFGDEVALDVMPKDVIIIKGTLRNKDTGEPVEAKVIYERLPEGVTVGSTTSYGKTGKYEIVLPKGHIYGYRAEVDGFLPISDNIDLTGDFPFNNEIESKMLLVPIRVGATVALNNIFFDFDKSSLKAESYPELKRVVKFLADNTNIEIGLAGHTDNIGTGMYNMRLAERRSRSVANYLTKNNIGKRRIEVQYYGKLRPVSSNESDEGRSNNRRVEFIILEK